MKKIFLILMGAFVLNFSGCGESDKEATELLQKILQIVGIPYDMVVQICQDSNGNGICNAGEITAKLSITKDDTAETIFRKFQLDENGQYILEHYDLKFKILMEIADDKGRFNTDTRVTLPFTPKEIVKEKPQELSILQSLVDKGLLQTDVYQEIKEAPKARNVVDQVLLENVFQNQQILEEHNLTAPLATSHNLAFIAEGLVDLNVTELVDNINECERNATQDCREVVIATDDGTEINQEDATIIQENNSTKETKHVGTTEDNNKTIVVSDDGNVSIVHSNEENTTTSEENNNTTSSQENNSTTSTEDNSTTPTPTPTATPIEKTEKNVADGYLIELSSPAIAYCGTNEYQSSLTVGEKGTVLFDNVTLTNDCSIVIPSGATIDSNNNGQKDDSDKQLTFDMKGYANGGYISPLTTLLTIKKENGEDVSDFETLVMDFDPVESASLINQKSGARKTELQKLLTLMELLKNSIGSSEVSVSELADINLSSIISTKVNESISDFDITKLTKSISNSNIKEKIEAKMSTFASIVELFDTLDSSKVDFTTLSVNISDGGKTMEEALKASLKSGVSLPSSSSLEEILNVIIIENTNMTPSIKANIISNFQTLDSYISNMRSGIFSGISRIFSNDFLSSLLFNHSVTENTIKFGTKSVELIENRLSTSFSASSNLDNFLDITLQDKGFPTTDFLAEKFTLLFNIVNKQDSSDYVNLKIANGNLSRIAGQLHTEFNQETTIAIEESKNGVVKTYSKQLTQSFRYTGFYMELNTLLSSLNDSEINSALDRMRGYFNTAGKSYTLSINVANSQNSVVQIIGGDVDIIGSNNSLSGVLKKTGQTKSYDEEGTEVVDSSVKDDGFYQKGAIPNYTRDNANEIVTDQLRGLMWQDDPAVTSVQKTWITAGENNNTTGDTATTYCDELVLGGFDDWRLPTRQELGEIVDYGRHIPAINMIFVNTYYGSYWTSSKYLYIKQNAWTVNFYTGGQFYDYTNRSHYVRCVRVKG